MVRAGPGAGRRPQDGVRHVRVGEEHAGQRIDNFLLREARGVPKSHVYRILRSGEVRVNGARARAELRLSLGDEIRIPPLRTSDAPAPAPAAMPPVLFEDEHLLVVDKPAGVAAHGGSGVAHGVIERARAARPGLPMLELAHRLDRETSGALMLAKSRKALLGLHSMQREGRIGKRYLALVIGDWVNDRQHARFALARRPEAVGGERRVIVDELQGQDAHTIFHRRERYGRFSLVEAELRTGRTHQIRVHLAHLGYPILGDDRYGDFEANRLAARGRWPAPQASPGGAPVDGPRLGRMFLHAWKLDLVHPVSGQALQIQAPLPPECEEVLSGLRRQQERAAGGRAPAA